MMKHLRFALALVITTLFVAACGTSQSPVAGPPVSDSSQFIASAAQQAAMTDGKVTREEYLDGFRRYSACLKEKGFDLLINDDTSLVVDIGIPQAAIDSGADKECYEQEWRTVDEAWQRANEEQLSEDNPVVDWCLEANGLPVTGTPMQKKAALVEANVDINKCLLEYDG